MWCNVCTALATISGITWQTVVAIETWSAIFSIEIINWRIWCGRSGREVILTVLETVGSKSLITSLYDSLSNNRFTSFKVCALQRYMCVIGKSSWKKTTTNLCVSEYQRFPVSSDRLLSSNASDDVFQANNLSLKMSCANKVCHKQFSTVC